MSASFSWEPPPQPRGSIGRSVLLALAVFAGGTGLGFVWKQGWLPIELLPAQTGVLDALTEDAADPPAPSSPALPLAHSQPTPGNRAAVMPSEPAEAEELFQQANPDRPTDAPQPPMPPSVLSEFPTEAATRYGRQREGLSGGSDRSVSRSTAATAPVVPAASAIRDGQVVGATFVETSEPAAVTQPVLSEPPVELNLEELLNEYDRKLNGGEVLAAHRLLSQAYWKHRDWRPELQERLDRSASAIFFQPQPHFVDPHVIEPGERLEAIATKYKVPWEYLSKLNRVDPKRIQAGKRLKVVRGPFSAVVELTDFSLTVHLQGYYVRRFLVGIGKDGASPSGKFSVLNKVVNPQYTDPDGQVIAGDDPSNPLGERWLDLGSSYGIHGTIDPESIGKAASRGCIRLNEADVVAVYDFLSVGSEVVIRR